MTFSFLIIDPLTRIYENLKNEKIGEVGGGSNKTIEFRVSKMNGCLKNTFILLFFLSLVIALSQN